MRKLRQVDGNRKEERPYILEAGPSKWELKRSPFSLSHPSSYLLCMFSSPTFLLLQSTWGCLTMVYSALAPTNAVAAIIPAVAIWLGTIQRPDTTCGLTGDPWKLFSLSSPAERNYRYVLSLSHCIWITQLSGNAICDYCHAIVMWNMKFSMSLSCHFLSRFGSLFCHIIARSFHFLKSWFNLNWHELLQMNVITPLHIRK